MILNYKAFAINVKVKFQLTFFWLTNRHVSPTARSVVQPLTYQNLDLSGKSITRREYIYAGGSRISSMSSEPSSREWRRSSPMTRVLPMVFCLR